MIIFIGFDFSINKPACTIVLFDKKIINHKFFIWPLNLNKKTINLWQDVSDVCLYNRDLPILKKNNYSSSDITFIHTKRSSDLSLMILKDINSYLNENIGTDWNSPNNKIYISSEGLSFSSHGNETMNLATYKGVLLSDLYRNIKIEKLCTYSPLTIKSIAGCAGKKDRGNKNAMINAFSKENDFESDIRNSLDIKLKSKKNYIHCVDDIVDSYWAMRTMYNKLDMNFIPQWKNQ